jgi:hypothetical protein
MQTSSVVIPRNPVTNPNLFCSHTPERQHIITLQDVFGLARVEYHSIRLSGTFLKLKDLKVCKIKVAASVVASVHGYRSRGSVFDSCHYQIF